MTTSYLILRLAGPMQAWGQPTFEGTRPTARFPTRSGLLGLLGACLGIKRGDRTALQTLSESVHFAIRCDKVQVDGKSLHVTGLRDYHTVQDAREGYRGLKSHETIQTWREYLCDATFTVAVWVSDTSGVTLSQLQEAVLRPRFTPFLGRKSCPLTQPLFVAVCEASGPHLALANYQPQGGYIYSESPSGEYTRRFAVRDEPIISLPRQFALREWYVIKGESDVYQ